MREFKCYDCQHTWQLPHGQGGRGVEQTCPKCASSNVHRAGNIRRWGRGARGGRGVGFRGVQDLGPNKPDADDS